MTFSDIVRELEEKAAATQARLQETRKRIRTEQRASNAGNKKVQKHLEIACAVMVLSNGDLRAAVGYCSQAGLEQTSSRRYLENRLLTGSLESLIEASYGTTQREVRLVAKARAFCSEWAVAQWVQSRNDMTELPPATNMFLCKWKWRQIEPIQKQKKCHWPNRKAELNGFGGSENDGRVATGA